MEKNNISKMVICIVCQQETDKYKCPRCLEPYCSAACYKKHKKVECSVKPSEISTTTHNVDDVELEPTLHQPFTTEDTVPREKLLELKNSEALRSLLYNPHLRNLLQQIDVATNVSAAMRAAMQEPLFLEFADECLKIVEPMSAEEQEELMANV